MPLSLFRRLLLGALLLVIVWALFGPSGLGEELLSLSLASLLPAPASPGPPLALPRLLIPNEDACGGPGAPPFLLILVSTAPENLNQRNAIRASWGGQREARGLRVQTLFLLGEPGGRHPARGSLENDLERESVARGDILQAAFQDSYRNLTLKTLSGLSWADKHCPRARYILKTDDDVFVNVPELVSELVRRGGRWEQWERGMEPQREAEAGDGGWEGGSPTPVRQPMPLLYLGRVHWRVHPSRTPGGKHQISEEQWPATWGPFPPYASGTGYVLSASAVQLILQVASRAPLLPLEDVFVGVGPLEDAGSLEAGGRLRGGKDCALLLLAPGSPGHPAVSGNSLASQLRGPGPLERSEERRDQPAPPPSSRARGVWLQLDSFLKQDAQSVTEA
ncbi:beta-1,3-galactosyltransferase 4 isoform X1 [Eptesicus fuscus]|uniref:beta-1,3-galactosyltransferase 4 isoform X1 n=1 Tax=Eptesicus fuscus TaxID=29078 RepID=UPI002403D2E4|nr:beta-1,3-galactosyltransferase 4 isoform X1 [Eptesicus fuscus]XP_054578481.1 beta-1,3-galactosyltransferase 4 isoform X1 [Eptesicus fuscus]